MSDKGFMWNPRNCECECDKSCDVGEYLDYKNCKCRKKLIDNLVEECSKNIDGNDMFYNRILDVISLNAIPLNLKKVCNSCTIYIVLFVVFFIISVCISSVFICFIGIYKRIMFMLSLNPVFKQQFIKCNSIEHR